MHTPDRFEAKFAEHCHWLEGANKMDVRWSKSALFELAYETNPPIESNFQQNNHLSFLCIVVASKKLNKCNKFKLILSRKLRTFVLRTYSMLAKFNDNKPSERLGRMGFHRNLEVGCIDSFRSTATTASRLH